MDMSYIMDSGQNWLYPTFPNIFSSISAESANLSQNQKNHFFKKNVFFFGRKYALKWPELAQ